MDKIELAICSLEMLRALMLFDPLTGEDISLDSLNRDNRELYDSADVAITALTEQAEREKGCEGCGGRSSVTRRLPYQCQYCCRNYCDQHDSRRGLEVKHG